VSEQRPPHRYQRIGAYGICRDQAGRLLLVRASKDSNAPGRWFLPGGGLEHGEDPLEGLHRELAEETGLAIDDVSLLGVLSDQWELPGGGDLHTVRIVYRIGRWSGTLRSEAAGSSDHAEWVPRDRADQLPLVGYVTEALRQFD
jgi:ADP-ribose pyrophosphatase YjhB (NUDIX family)